MPDLKLGGPSSLKVLILAFAAFIALAASGTLRWYAYSPSHDEQRAVQLVLIWMVGVACLVNMFSRPALAGWTWCGRHRRNVMLLATFFGFGLASAALASLPAWALLEWSHLLLLVLLCIALSFAIDRVTGAQNWLYLALVTAAIFYMVQVLVLYAGGIGAVGEIDNSVVVVGFSHRRFAAQMHALLIPMLGALYFQYDAPRKPMVRKILLLLAGFAWMLCIVAAARGAALALAASVVALGLLGRDAWFRWMKFYGGSLLIGIALCALLFVLLPAWLGATMTWENRLLSSPGAPTFAESPGRMFLWAKALKMAIGSPLLGIGPMHFAYQFHNEGSHPHNLPLQLAAEWGPLAMLCFIGVLLFGYVSFGKFACMRVRARSRQTRHQATAEGLWAALTIIAAYAFLDGLFVMPYSQMLVVLFAAWAMALVRTETMLNEAPTLVPPVMSNAFPGKIFKGMAGVAIVIALTSVAASGFPAMGTGKSQEREDFYQRSTGIDFLFPRFWVQGWIGPLPRQTQ